jgi:hypothetical protein
MDTVVKVRWWRVTPDEIPVGRQERIDWLFTWWARIDDWIGEQRAATAAGTDGSDA